MRALASIAMTLLLVSSAGAADWDHDANIARGVAALRALRGEAEATHMQKAIADCYASLGEAPASDESLRQLEFCAGMDFAGYLLARDRGDLDETSFFAPPRMLERMQPLTHWIESPNVQGEVLRAWSRSAANALAGRPADD